MHMPSFTLSESSLKKEPQILRTIISLIKKPLEKFSDGFLVYFLLE